MEWLIFIAVLVVLGIIGYAMQAYSNRPEVRRRDEARRVELARQGLALCPTCRGSGKVWNGNAGGWDPKTNIPRGANVTCTTCGGRGVLRLHS